MYVYVIVVNPAAIIGGCKMMNLGSFLSEIQGVYLSSGAGVREERMGT